MKNNDKISRTFSILLVALLILILLSCEQSETLSPFESENTEGTSNSLITSPFAKPVPPVDPSTELYPQIGWHVYKYWKAQDSYRGGTLNMPNGTFFQLIAGSLIPPSPNDWGTNIKVHMEIEKNESTNELIFTLGPAGCTFNPAAKIYLSYDQLNIDAPVLYYIDNNGNYIEQEPDEIDLTKKSIILYIDHFSRYAIGME